MPELSDYREGKKRRSTVLPAHSVPKFRSANSECLNLARPPYVNTHVGIYLNCLVLILGGLSCRRLSAVSLSRSSGP
jgi:hypothetical protein